MKGGLKIRKTIIVGIIGFTLISSFGLLTIDSWSVYLDFGANNEITPPEIRLNDLVENPKSYLGETVTVEGYIIFLRCLPDTRCFNDIGDFLLVESIENPGDISIWINIINKTISIPPSDSKVLITGEIAHVEDQEELYRIDAQKIDVLNRSTIPSSNYLELFTDKYAYELGEEIILTFTNHGPDKTVTLPNGAPFTIEYHDPESTTVSIYSPMAIQVLIPVSAGESMTWTLNESPGLKGAGYYKISFQVYVDESFETLETLYTKFTIGIQQSPYELDLFTDKSTYRRGEKVILTFVNNGPEGTEAILLNGNPFEIEFQDLETREVTVYTLPSIEILIIIPAGKSMTWILSDAEGLMGTGDYYITFQVTVNEQVEYLNTKFSVDEIPHPSLPQLVLYPNKFMFEPGEEVILTFMNLGSGEKNVILPNGFPVEIEYRDLDTGEVLIYSLPATEAEVPVLEGDSIMWILSEDQGLKGAGYYVLTLRVYVDENSENLYTWFTYGIPPSASELFTDKGKYTDGEDVKLTFINHESFTVNAGYCLDITYQMQETSPRIPLILSCIEILVILPPGENITWTFTQPELMGPGYYTVHYKVYSEEEERQLVFQTKFEIEAAPIASDLFTDKKVYEKGENVTLTFINREAFTVNAGYCLDITYTAQETGASSALFLPCIEILVILHPGENITWTFTPSQLMGPGHYKVNYNVYNEVDGRMLMFQTEFEILPGITIWNPNNGMFVPGFEMLASFIGILSVLLVRSRKKSKLT